MIPMHCGLTMGAKLQRDQISNCTQRPEFTLNILFLQSTVIRHVNCTNAYSVFLNTWLARNVSDNLNFDDNLDTKVTLLTKPIKCEANLMR